MQLSARAESRVIANQITRGGGVSTRGYYIYVLLSNYYLLILLLDPKMYYLQILYAV